MVEFDFTLAEPAVRHKRAKTPTILQMDAMECGAVCMSIIMAYHGLHISSEKAREACGVTRDGSKAINIIKAARNFGMEAEGTRISDIDSLRYKKTPFIVFWKFEHYIVVEEVGDKKVWINDPDTGPRCISIDEFDKGFTGVVLLIKPGKDFKKSGHKEHSILTLFLEYLRGEFQDILYLFVITLLLSIPLSSLAFFLKVYVDDVLINNQRQWMLGCVAGMGLATMSVIILTRIQQVFILRYQIRFSIQKIPEFFWKILQLPMPFFIQRSTGDIANRVTIYDKIAQTITESFPQAFTGMLSVTIYTIFIFMINPVIGCITAFITALNIIVLLFLKRKIVDAGRRVSQDSAKLFGIEYNGIHIIEELRFRGAENQFFMRWASYQARLMESRQTLELYNAWVSSIPGALYFINLVTLVIVGSYFITQGSMTAGGMIAIYTLLLTFATPVKTVIEALLKLNELKADLLRIIDINSASTPARVETPPAKENVEYLLEINDLMFGYSKIEAPVLLGIDIALKRGKSLAITGVSGSGKSSLSNLICGLYEPWSGKILFNGIPIQEYDPADLFKHIAYVDQNTFLFEGSIRDNLTFKDTSISDKEIYQALEAACAVDIIKTKGGLDFHITEGGRNLSTGQAQRIELARAILRKPELMLLDEATSALDSVTEAQIYNNLRAMQCSFIIIAHRLSALRHCDEIMVIEEGSVIEYGSYQALMEKRGRYYEFVQKDFLS